MFSPSLKPVYNIADFQLCFYSAPALRQALENRRILDGKTIVIIEGDNC